MRRFISIAAMAVALATAAEARADGVVLDPGALSSAHRTALERGVRKARSNDAAAFTLLAQVRSELPDLDAQKRGRMASITPMLRGMGKRALWPMLEELALDAAPRGALTSSAWRAWRISLLEAVGALRDSRARGVLAAILDSGEGDSLVLRAAAQALGKEGSDAAANKLIALSQSASGARRRAILAGMGHCRREIVAEHLADALASTQDHRNAKILARSLGDVGSAWAWETPSVQKSGEEDATRANAAEALVRGFVAFDDAELRERFTQAILVVDWQATPSLIASARRGASQELRAALAELERRFADSPLH
jgi:hypothetical protein